MDNATVNKQADTLGSIIVRVERAQEVRRAKPKPSFVAHFPSGGTVKQVSKELVKKHVSHYMEQASRHLSWRF